MPSNMPIGKKKNNLFKTFANPTPMMQSAAPANDPVAGAKDFLAQNPARPAPVAQTPPPPPEATGLRAMFGSLMNQASEMEPIKTVLGLKDWLTRPNPGVEGLMPTTPQIVPGASPTPSPVADPTNHRLRLNQTFGKIPPR